MTKSPLGQHAPLRQPDEGRVIRLAAAVEEFEPLPADRQRQGVVIDLVRAALADRVDVARHVELLALHEAVEAVRVDIALHAPGDIAMGDNARTWPSARIRLLVDQLDAAGVVDMAMGEDHGVDRAIVPGADDVERLPGGVGLGRIDQHEAFRRADRRDAAAEIRGVDGDDVVVHLRDRAMRDCSRPFLHRGGAVPETLEQRVLFHAASSGKALPCLASTAGRDRPNRPHADSRRQRTERSALPRNPRQSGSLGRTAGYELWTSRPKARQEAGGRRGYPRPRMRQESSGRNRK